MEKVIEYNANLKDTSDQQVAAKYGQLARILGLPARTTREGYVNFLQAVRQLKRDLHIPASIKAAGIQEEEFMAATGTMAEQALADRCTPSNPRTPAKEDIIAIYKAAY